MSGRATLLLVVFLLSASRAATALTILDVVQLSQRNYSDAQIIEIIEATNAVFELEATDLPRLKELGVTEAVIRVMLKRRPPPSTQVSGELADPATGAGNTLPRRSPVTPAAATSLADLAQRANAQRQATRSATATSSPSAVPASRTRTVPSGVAAGYASRVATFAAVAEDRAGDHAHVAVVLGGLDLFVLRDEASYRTIADRADALASQLEAVRAGSPGEFQYATVGGRDAVVFRRASDQEPLVITIVTFRDAVAYEIRSARKVSTSFLARYWADVLSDYWSMVVDHRAPTRLTGLRHGDALTALFRALQSDALDQQPDVKTLVARLPTVIQQRLLQLARTVPSDYRNRVKEGL